MQATLLLGSDVPGTPKEENAPRRTEQRLLVRSAAHTLIRLEQQLRRDYSVVREYRCQHQQPIQRAGSVLCSSAKYAQEQPTHSAMQHG